METRKIKISEIEMNEDRTEGGKGDIESLARNLEKYGQINAVTVTKTGFESEGIYRVIAGRRRIIAAKSLGWEEIRADVYDFGEINAEDEEMLALSENAAREEMNAIDEGILYANELKKGTPVEELAALFCRSKKTVYQRAKLAQLIPELREFYKAEKLPLHLAAMAVDLPEEAQKKCAEKCKARTWGTISEWEVKAIVSEVSEDYVENLGKCAMCENCAKRTRYSDKTLFPELADTIDRCLDHSCYLKNLKAKIEKEYEGFSADKNSDYLKRIITDEELPEELKLNISIGRIENDEEDLTDITPEEDTGIKTKLETLGKVEFVTFWNGDKFELRELAKKKDIEEIYNENGNQKKEPSEYEKSQKAEIADVFRNMPEESLKPVLDNYSSWWEMKRKISEGFEERLRKVVLEENDEKILEKEQLALIVLMNCGINELKDIISDVENEKLYSYSEYKKLLKVNRGLLIRILLKSFLSGYRAKPGITGVEESEWQKIFSHIDVNLASIRDEAVRNAARIEAVPEENTEDSEEYFDEDIEKFGEISDVID